MKLSVLNINRILLKPLKRISGLFLLFSFSCWANVNSINDLFSQAEQLKISDQTRFNIILIQLSSHGSELSEIQVDELEYLKTFNKIRSGLYDEAILLLNEQIKRSKFVKIKVRAHLSLSNIHAFTGSYEHAFISLKYISEHINEINDSELKNVMYLAMANTYSLTGQHDLSMKLSKIVLSDELDGYNSCRANTFYTSAAIKSNAQEFSELDINSTFKLCVDQEQYPTGHFVRMIWISNQVDKMEAPYDTNILRVYLSHLEKENNLNDIKLFKSLELTELSLKAQIHWMLGEANEAEIFAMQVINSPDTMGDNEPRITAYKVLKELANESGDHEKAYDYLSKLSEIEAAFHQDNQMKQMAFMNVQHANLAREMENQQLNETNKLLQVEQNLAAQEALNQKLIVALLLFVLSVLAYVLYRMKVKHNELESLAVMDHLTKVLNRKGFELQINEMLSESQSTNKELHVAILDLDHFKLVNDEHGHLTGDWILKHVIYEVKKHMDSNMVIGRLGGEEFGIIGRNMSSKVMDERIEHIRKAVEQLECKDSGHDISITASFGISSSELSGHTMEMMLGHADLALYQAKSRGRNQWVRYQYIN